jgi:hypothetical protein
MSLIDQAGAKKEADALELKIRRAETLRLVPSIRAGLEEMKGNLAPLNGKIRFEYPLGPKPVEMPSWSQELFTSVAFIVRGEVTIHNWDRSDDYLGVETISAKKAWNPTLHIALEWYADALRMYLRLRSSADFDGRMKSQIDFYQPASDVDSQGIEALFGLWVDRVVDGDYWDGVRKFRTELNLWDSSSQL